MEFTYKGITFEPYRNFTANETERLWEYTGTALELDFDFDRDEFYAAAKKADAYVDIFITGTNYVTILGSSIAKMHPENAPEIHRITYKTVEVEVEPGEEDSVTDLLPAISPDGIQDFYPTPKAVSKLMLDVQYYDSMFCASRFDRDTMRELAKTCWEPLHKKHIKTILEPSAGRGDLAAALKERFDRYVKIDCIEVNPDLQAILKGKGFRVVHDDFLTFNTEFCYDLIVMNPPFSNAVAHVRKAMDLQRRNGGLVIALVNAETVRNLCTRARRELLAELEELDAEITFVKNGFTRAARSTDVETAIIKVAMPEPKIHESFIFEQLTKEESFSFSNEERTSNEMQPYAFAEQLVHSYNLEIKLGLRMFREYNALKPYILADFKDEREQRNEDKRPSEAMLKLSPSDPNDYIKGIRKKYWTYALNNPEVYGRLTSDLQREWRNRVDEMAEYDFTLFNIKAVMLEMMNQVAIGVNDAILNFFDKFTKYAIYDGAENVVHYYNAWRTNSAYKVNKKVILPCWGAINQRDWSSDYGKLDVYEASRILSDIEKVFSFLDDGSSPNIDLTCALQWAAKDGKTRKIKTKFFEVSFFKKGTMHIVFSDQRLLDAFNIYGGRKRNWLPETYGVKTYEAMDDEERAVIDSFQGRDEYEKVIADKQFYLQEPATKQFMLGA